ncbi:zinc finger, CCHC-type containing protein [Tanacetum coccineum]
MERFEKTIYNPREEINDRMAKMFGPLKELTISRTPEKVLVREEARHPITRNVNAISLVKMEKEKNIKNNEVVDRNIVELSELNAIEPKEIVDMKKEVEDGANDEPVRNMEEEITGDGIKELVEMPRTYVQRNPQEKDNKKEDMGGNFVIPCIAEDVLVEIAGYIYPIDFVILDVKEDKKNPFILRTPFLTTTKAEIRFDKGTINLKSGKNKINFFKIPESLCRVEEGNNSEIDPAAPTTTVSRLILEWEERIKLHQEKEMEFNQWRSKVFNDERSALVNEGCKVIFDNEKPESS